MSYPYLPYILSGNVAVVNNITNQSAANVAIGSPGAVQTNAQVATNQVGIAQGFGRL